MSYDVKALVLCSLLAINGTNGVIYCRILYLQSRLNACLLWVSAERGSLSKVYVAFKILFSVCVVFMLEDSCYLVQCEMRDIRTDDAQPTVMPGTTKFCHYNFHIMFDRAAWTSTRPVLFVVWPQGFWPGTDLELDARCCHTVAFKILLVFAVVLGSNLLRMSPHVHLGIMLTFSMGICESKPITPLAVFVQHFKDKKNALRFKVVFSTLHFLCNYIFFPEILRYILIFLTCTRTLFYL